MIKREAEELLMEPLAIPLGSQTTATKRLVMAGHPGEWMVVHGSLTIETVPALFETGLQHLAGEDFQVDFSQIDSVDSAAVSMLLGWTRAAQRTQHDLRVKGLPEDLLSLARLYGVAELLPQQSN